MASSRHSPASSSSSDLYSESETPQDAAPSRAFKSSRNTEGRSIHPVKSMESSRDNTPPDVRMSSEEDSVTIKAGSPGNYAYGNYKRKREEDTELLANPNRSISASTRTKDRESRNTEPSTNGGKHHGADYHNTKRTRTSETPYNIGRDSPSLKGTRIGQASMLSSQIWQHVFCFVPPVFLGRLLRVNRSFNALLTNKELSIPRAEGSLQHVSPESIWQASRKRFAPGLPRPLRELNELDMWRLLRGSDCQVCGEKKTLLTTHGSTNPWNSGPGSNGVRVIWPFGIRTCADCLRVRTEKVKLFDSEIDLLLTSAFPSFLLPALSYAFVSQTDHYVASTVLRNGAPPSELQLIKLYYKPHIQDIKNQLDQVRELGSASAEEWIKGLDMEGKDRLNDAARWETWEAKGGLAKVNAKPNSRSAIRIIPGKDVSLTLENEVPNGNQSGQPGFPTVSGTETGSNRSLSFPQEGTTTTQSLQSSATALHNGLPQRPQPSFQLPRQERSIRDVNEAKAARRAEIERLCMTLGPPLEPNVLQHMESFQAAIQISTPLTENAWTVLKPRLLAQREAAESRENERIQQGKMLQAKSEERRHQEAQLKEVKETLDKEWDLTQTPIRQRLAAYADEIIRDSWSGGDTITKETCPKFAADVLIYTRRRFYEDLVNDDAARHAAGETIEQDTPNGPPKRKLILENMKWLFDNKIKAFTENFQKELFLCNGCEGNFKFYGFEGVIQHYAAKHTTILSVGSVVVHWRAEWPEHPPFHPDPSAARAAFHSIPPPIHPHMHGPYNKTPQMPHAFPPYGQNAVSGPPMGYPGYDAPPFSPAPIHVTYHNSYQAGGYPQPPVNVHPMNQAGYSGPPIGKGPNHPYAPMPNQNAPPSAVNDPATFPGYPHTPMSQYTHPYSDRGYPDPAQYQRPVDQVSGHYPGGAYSHPLPNNQPIHPSATYPPMANATPGFVGQNFDLYQAQMTEMAKEAREIWFKTGGIKDIPQSVRIFVVIHHVAFKFEQKYTNDLSLAMFLDGLDQNSQMRPVRSLNGLACRTCVNSSARPVSGFPHSQVPIGDRKLYTLPQLLYHFKTAHLDVSNPAEPHYDGSQPPRYDWKRDMIELPESSLIKDLITAPGMDDEKLGLIARVFPRVFPDPLPKMGSGGNPGPVPKYRDYYANSTPNRYKRDPNQEAPRMEPQVIEDRSDEPSHSRPYSALQVRSPSTAHDSEPPGEDEYDPHRPAYLGRIVQSSSTKAPVRNQVKPSPLKNQFPPNDVEQSSGSRQFESTSPQLIPDSGKPEYDIEGSIIQKSLAAEARSQHQRHVSRDHNVQIEPTDPGLNGSLRQDQRYRIPKRGGRYGYTPEDGELDEEPPSAAPKESSASPTAEHAAADKFLSNLNPTLQETRINPGPHLVSRGAEIRYVREELDDARERSSKHHSVPREATVEVSKSRKDISNKEVSYRTTPSHEDAWEPRNDGYPQQNRPMNGYGQLEGRHQTSSRPEYVSARASADRQPYDHYDYTYSTVPHGETIDHGLDRPRSRYQNVQYSYRTQHRKQSRSPQPSSHAPSAYRARSPVELPRQNDAYHIPSPNIQRDGRAQQPIYYDVRPAPKEYAYVRDPEYFDEPSRRQVKYVPVRPEEYGVEQPDRYVLASPAEYREAAGNVRLVRGYPGEPYYERGPQVIYAEQPVYETRSNRAPMPGPLEYGGHGRIQ
ncbi:MAG: hypothetical protein MMC33_001843 [Icmadophila ericetorum]|nr:hypothetical protein [Icmadophila ericetorum]